MCLCITDAAVDVHLTNPIDFLMKPEREGSEFCASVTDKVSVHSARRTKRRDDKRSKDQDAEFCHEIRERKKESESAEKEKSCNMMAKGKRERGEMKSNSPYIQSSITSTAFMFR